jgi:methionyl-tRNA synthetase
MEKFYLTTAIDYVNDRPHLGTAYEKIAADVIARFKRMAGYDTFFLMGNDEHSLNVAARAKKLGLDVLTYCDQMEEEFRTTWKKLHISFDDFIRTTQPRHISTVNQIIERVYRKKDIYKGSYTGWYCPSCENFYRDKDLIDGLCPTHKLKPQWVEEENYFFALSKYGEPLLSHIDAHPDFIQPETRRNEVLQVIRGGLEDISISRSSTAWGISLPFDLTNVVYVWIDALINYLSGAGFSDDPDRYAKYWPANLHIIGKDITRFHCIIWPALLMSSGIPLPHTIFAHGFVNIEGQKMSKTKGIILDPAELAEKYDADALRYFLIREIPFDKDGDFSIQRFKERYNADLANDYGNLMSRTLAMVGKYYQSVIPQPVEASNDSYLRDIALKVLVQYREYMENLQLHEALKVLWKLIREANTYIDNNKPWELNKSAEGRDRLSCVLYNVIESLRYVSIMLKPIMPVKTEEAWEKLGMPQSFKTVRFEDLQEWGGIEQGLKVDAKGMLFPRIED